MKTTDLIAIAVALVLSACTLPADDTGELPADEEIGELESFATEPQVSSLESFALEEPDEPEQWLTRCWAACRGGEEAILAFCATIPDFRVRAACRGLTLASEQYCRNWCYWYFGQ